MGISLLWEASRASHGSEGYNDIFLSNKNFIYCSYYWNRIHTDSRDLYMSTRLTHQFYRIIASDNIKPTDNKPQMIQLVIDGKWGLLVTLRLQEYYNTTRDKVISHQYKQKYNHLFIRI